MGDRPAFDEAKRGSAELLILALVENDDLHGYEIGRQIEVRSGGTLTLHAGGALRHALSPRRRGAGSAGAGSRRPDSGGAGTTGSPRRAGRVLAAQREDWARFVAALGQVAGVRYA